ncbi:ECF RNA polymerase sigma-E factor [Pedobacter glucosidilyticus]|nr:RNA polymerase sigma factor [Pedobacter glucosidilyticus]KHJ37990.1 ECF RNA polymerase sigma-E factor [Pedobacter glucosidilyticus]
MTEAQLILQLKNGERQAYQTLVKNYQHKVYNTALSFLQDGNDAQDLTQEVFIEVYHTIHQFKGAAKLATWIYRITVNTCLEELRRRKRKKRMAFIISIFDTKYQTEIDKYSDFEHPGIKLENKEHHQYLNKALMALPEHYRTVIVLHKLEGLSQQEIAEILDKSVSAVESIMVRAKQQLKLLLIDKLKDKG